MTIYEVSADFLDNLGNFHSHAIEHWRPICTNLDAAKWEAKECMKQAMQFAPQGCHVTATIRVMTDDSSGRFRGYNNIEVKP